MTTNNSIDSNIPISVSKGGTGSSALSVQYGVLYNDGSNVVTVSSLGSSPQIFTSNGASSAPTFQNATSGIDPDPSFLAITNASVTQNNITGDGTEYTVQFDTVRVNTGSAYDGTTGVFTASSTNVYFLSSYVSISSMVAATAKSYSIELVTSNRRYSMIGNSNGESNGNKITKVVAALADMDSSDTAEIRLTAWEGTKNVNVYVAAGASDYQKTMFSGFIIGT